MVIRNQIEVTCSHLKRCQELIQVPAFNIWSADTLIELVVGSDVRGIAGDHPFAVLKS